MPTTAQRLEDTIIRLERTNLSLGKSLALLQRAHDDAQRVCEESRVVLGSLNGGN